MGLYSNVKTLAGLWADKKKRQLQHTGTPNTKIDSGGSQNNHSWTEQSHERGKLREVKEIRDSGGIVARLLHWKALVFFGTGVEVNTQDNEDLKEWIRQEPFPNLDSLLTELGEDSLWFPYALGETVETRGGGFSHYEPVEPWTTLPVEDEYGKIVAWEQEIQADYGTTTETYEPDDLQSFIVNKSSARDNTGISDVIRAEGTIDQFYENRNAAQNAMDQAGFRRLVAKVGREDGGVIDDNELRRVRNRINNLKEDTVLVTGPHVEFKLLDAMDPSKFKEMREMDLRGLCLALGVPIEFASVISEGLGSGEQSGLRERAFILEGKAAQRLLGGQFTEQVLRPVVEEYSPYDADDLRGITFGEPVPDEPSLEAQAPYLKTNEIREMLDKPPEEDEELGESYQDPAQVEAPEDEGMEPGGGGGFFSDGRQLQSEIPDNARPIDSPDECDGSVVQGPQGGTYCVPSGEDSGDPSEEGTGETRDEIDTIVESVDLTNTVETETGDVTLSNEAQEELRNEIADRFGEEATTRVYDNIGSWKNRSYSDSGQRLERAFAAAVGVDENIRNGELDGGEPTEDEIKVAGAMVGASREFIRENYGEEMELKRGLSDFGTGQLLTEWLNTPGDESVEFNLSAMSNFTTSDVVADKFAGDRAKFETNASADEVLLASDFIHGSEGVDEGEIAIEGLDKSVNLEDIDVFGDLLPLSPEDMDDEQLSGMVEMIESQGETMMDNLSEEGKQNLQNALSGYSGDIPESVSEAI